MRLNRLYREQETLAKRVVLYDAFGKVRTIAGVDCACQGDRIICGAVALDYDTLEPAGRAHAVLKLTFPYIPGLLAYREARAMVSAVRMLVPGPDVLMVDGFGVNHPRRCGIATHVGLRLDLPTIGVGKSFLCGEVRDDTIYQSGEPVGMLLHSGTSKKPAYVSPGHRISLETAVEIVRKCTVRGRLPEPIRLAHEYAGKIKRELAAKP